MPKMPLPPDAVRAVDAANEAIRRFMEERAGRPLFEAERAEYARLVVAWTVAQRGGLAGAT
ncbi:hypothetical protein [Streptomyces sp. NPDC097640]|uniref:hypothetical protein n=1 Tax=Streptomyces sp. NPDC097640 TaxID=3157229 RepID=UPI00331CCBB3